MAAWESDGNLWVLSSSSIPELQLRETASFPLHLDCTSHAPPAGLPKQGASSAARQQPASREADDGQADEDSDGELLGFEQQDHQFQPEPGALSPQWSGMLDKLRGYREEYGDCDVPRWVCYLLSICWVPACFWLCSA